MPKMKRNSSVTLFELRPQAIIPLWLITYLLKGIFTKLLL
jgi:hypothetical protein